jgi:hypothetical protein
MKPRKSKLSKTKLLIMSLPLMASLSLTGATFAHEGTGVRGGGVTVDVNGRPTLKDLVDNTDCIWIKASDLAKTLPHFPVIEANIEKESWYLELNIEQELANLNVCQTPANLITVSSQDQDGVTIDTTAQTGGKTAQVGVRLNEEIFLDTTLFKQMSPIDQAYLLLHETLHSFIPLDASQRNERLRSFVEAVRDLETTQMSQQSFAFQMANDDIDMLSPAASEKTLYETAMNTSASLVSRVSAIQQICAAAGSYIPVTADEEDYDGAQPFMPTSTCPFEEVDVAAFNAVLVQGKHQILIDILGGNTNEVEQFFTVGQQPVVEQFGSKDFTGEGGNLLKSSVTVTAKNYCAAFYGSPTSQDCDAWPEKSNGKIANQNDYSVTLSIQDDTEIDTLQLALYLSNFDLAQFMIAHSGYDWVSNVGIVVSIPARDTGGDGKSQNKTTNSEELAALMGRSDLAAQIQALWKAHDTKIDPSLEKSGN